MHRKSGTNLPTLQLHALAYNLGNFLRTLATPEPARPSPRQWQRCRTAASSATTQAARRIKGTVRPHARPGDEPSLVRHGMSVA